MTSVKEIAAFLDRSLAVADFDDTSHNGLQVANSGRVDKVCCGVDASMEFFDEARRRGAGLLICHHGISWGDSLKRITDLNYHRVSFLLRHDLALYACHLPLDAHPRYGNNARLCRALGVRRCKPFGLYRGRLIGFQGVLPRAMRYDTFKAKVAAVLGRTPQTMDFGGQTVRSVAVVSGGAAGELDEAGLQGIDVYVTGEPALVAYSRAQEYGINAVFGGHYATETFGVRALGELVTHTFGVGAEFVDLQVPF